MDRQKLHERLMFARGIKMSPEAREQQRRSFAYGNAHIENPRITKRAIDKAADRLSARAANDPTDQN